MKTDTLIARFSKKWHVPRQVVQHLIEACLDNERTDIGSLMESLTKVYERFAGVSDPLTSPEEVIELAIERREAYIEEEVAELMQYHLAPNLN